MDKADSIAIHMRPDCDRLQVETVGQINRTKEITVNRLQECLSEHTEIAPVVSGVLPTGCIHVGFYKDYREVVLSYHGLYADISYRTHQFPHFPLPRLVFSFCVSDKGKVGTCRIGVMKDETPRPDTPMYLYPFSNILKGSRICLGSNSLPDIKELRTLWTLPGLILSFPNNDDSFQRSSNKLQLGYKDLLEHLKDKEPSYYYDKVLVASSFTLQDFIDGRGCYET